MQSFILNILHLPNTSLFNLEQCNLLSKIEEAVIGLGLKFIPFQSTSIKQLQHNLTLSLSKYTRQLLLRCYFGNTQSPLSFIPKLDNNTWLPPNDKDPSFTSFSNDIKTWQLSTLQSINNITVQSHLTSVESTIINTLKNLSTRADIVIKPADKNLGTCIMYSSTYDKYCLSLLNDRSTYLPVVPNKAFANLPNYKQKHILNGYALLKQVLFKHKVLFQRSHRSTFKIKQPTEIRPICASNAIRTICASNTPTKLAKSLFQLSQSDQLQPYANFYILMKMHKPTISGRPIANCKNTMTYHASVFVDNALKTVVKQLQTVTMSSMKTILLLEATTLPINQQDITITCADVKNLYPSIPIQESLIIIKPILLQYQSSSTFDVDLILDLLYWILTNNFIAYGNQFFRQISGTAMGTPCAPSFANIFLFALEAPLVMKYQPLVYQRYLDDLFIIFDSPTTAANFIRAFNQRHPNIQLDAVTHGQSGIFLDLEIYLDNATNGKCQYKLYQKPMNKYLYLPPTSSHDNHIIKNFIVNELKRYLLYNTKEQDYQHQRNLFYHRLQQRGYSNNYLDSVFNIVLPSRDSMLLDYRTRFGQSMALASVKRSDQNPIVILPSSKVSNKDNTYFKYLFQLPQHIIRNKCFQLAYPSMKSNKPIYGKKLNKSIVRILSSSLRPNIAEREPLTTTLTEA